MRRLAPVLLLVASSAASAQDVPSTERRLELHASDVGRLALKNGPGYKARELDPAIARTRVDEALAAFDSLFTAHAGFGGSRSEVFFDPAATRAPESRGSRVPTASESHVVAGTAIGATQEWGGSWRLGYDARSTDRRGATTFDSLEPRFDGGLSGTYRQPLLRGAGRDANLAFVREADRLWKDAELELAREAELTVERAEAAYWDLVGARAGRDLTRKSLDVATELHALVKARVDSGRGIPVDVTEAVAGIARREVELITAENVVANAADRLRELVLPFDGDAPDLDLVIVPADVPGAAVDAPTPPPGRAELETAAGHRADIRAARMRVEAARFVEERAQVDLGPQLDAVVSSGLRGQGSGFDESAERISDRRAYRWDAGIELSIPLGNLAAEARASRARLERERRERDIATIRNSVIREVREAARNVRSSADRIEAARRATEAAREQLDAERSRLEGGRATPFDVLQAEEELTKSAASEILARVDYEKARVQVLRAGGTLLESRGLASPPAVE